MILLVSISGLCCLTAFVHYLTKPVSAVRRFKTIHALKLSYVPLFHIQVVRFLSATTNEEKQLLEEIKVLKNELEDIPMRTEYPKYVRVERKIVAAQAKLTELRNEKLTKNLALQFAIPYGTQVVLSIVLLVVSIMCRYTPVIVFDGQQYDLVPFGALIRFPTGIDGAVSVPFWILVNSFAFKHLASYVV